MRASWARLTRIRRGVPSTPRGRTDGSTAGTANPTSRLASARLATTFGSSRPASWWGSPVNTPESTSPAKTSPTWLVWPASRGTAWSRWLRNWPRKLAAAARPPGVATSPVRARVATSAAATARPLAPSQPGRPRRASGTGAGAGSGPAVAVAAVAVAVRAAASRARRCSNRSRAASTAAPLGGAPGAVRAIAGAASSALRWSSATVSEQAAQACTWPCRAVAVAPSGASSMDARRAPRSGQGIVGSRVGVVAVEVGVAEPPLAAGEQDPDRADGEVEGRGNLRVGVAGVAQQQAGALPLGQGGEGLADRPLLLGPEHLQQRGGAGVGLVVGPLGPARPVQPVAGPAPAPQPVVGGIQADTAQPGRDLLVGPVEDGMPVEPEEGLLHDVLGLTAVPEQPVGEPVQVAVPLPEHGGKPFPGAGPGPDLIRHGTHQPLLLVASGQGTSHSCSTPPGRWLLHRGPAAGDQVGDGRAGQLDQHHPEPGEQGDDQGRAGREDRGQGDDQDALADAEAGRGEQGEEADGVGGGVGGHHHRDVRS